MSAHSQYLTIRTISFLPGWLQTRLSGEPAIVMDGQRLDPQVQLLRSIRRRRNAYGLVEPTIAAGRARYRFETQAFRGPMTPVAAVRDFEIPAPGGPRRARHYSPGVQAPLTVYLHGGGFVIGDLDTHDEPCRILCSAGRTHVVSIDYRLAPEHPFPAAVDDARAALAWAQANAASLGADAGRIGIGGDSAGANLATVAARFAAEEGSPPAAQLLIYPPTDGVTERPSYALFGTGFMLTTADREAFLHCYIDGTGVAKDDPRLAPLHARDLSGLPPTLVVTAGYDLLRDEGEAYGAALRAAGVAVRARRFPGLGHGFIHLTGVCGTARKAMRWIAHEWREVVEG